MTEGKPDLAQLEGLSCDTIQALFITHRRGRYGFISGRFFDHVTTEAVEERGLLALHSSPKGRKHWYELTDKGRALIPAALAWRAERERQSQERIRNAAPDLLKALRETRVWVVVATHHTQTENAAMAKADLQTIDAAIAKAEGR